MLLNEAPVFRQVRGCGCVWEDGEKKRRKMVEVMSLRMIGN